MFEAKHPDAVLISRDLFFTSKVTGTANALGIPMRVVAAAQSAAELVAVSQCRCLFVDLAEAGLDLAGLIGSLPANRKVAVVAYGSHVATALLQAAREAGCTEVMPRSRFSGELPAILRQYCGGESNANG